MREDVRQRLVEVADAVRLPGDERVDGDAHHASVVGPFAPQRVELVANGAGEVFAFIRAAPGDRIVDLHGVGDRDQPTPANV